MRTLKAIIGGALLGTAFFFIPFVAMRILLFVFVIGFLFRVFGRRNRWGRRGGFPFAGNNQFAFANYIRGMSDDEYIRFQEHFATDCHQNMNEKRDNANSNESSNI